MSIIQLETTVNTFGASTLIDDTSKKSPLPEAIYGLSFGECVPKGALQAKEIVGNRSKRSWTWDDVCARPQSMSQRSSTSTSPLNFNRRKALLCLTCMKIKCSFFSGDETMAFQYYSIPVDHYDPKMQFAVKAQQELKSIFDKFQFKTVTTSSLRAFGDALVPTEKKKKEANAVIEEVREVVTKCPGFKINRICVSGSYGKKTCLPSFDLDMIVFINDEAPPFTRPSKVSKVTFSSSYMTFNLTKNPTNALHFTTKHSRSISCQHRTKSINRLRILRLINDEG